MRTFARLLASSFLAVAVAAGTALPASAAPDATAATPVHAAAVTGEAWSAPAFPVACDEASRQVSCTPTDPSLVKPQQCFINVLYGGQRTTLCTTFEGHVDAIRSAGGKPLLVQYGCSVGDVVCVMFENAGRGMAISATSTMKVVADNTRFDTDSVLWSAAVNEWSYWQWAVLVFLFGAFVWAITAAAVSGSRDEVLAVILRCGIAVFAIPAGLWTTGKLLDVIDEMTWYIMDRDGPGAMFATMQQVMWAGGEANYYFAFLIHNLLALGMLLLMLVFAFRNIALAALVAVGPIAWMLFPIRSVGKQWAIRYVSALVVLLLTGPLTVGFMSLIVRGLASVKTIWDPQAWPLLIGLALVAFAPFAVFGLFSFVGSVAADSIGSRIGAHAARTGTNVTRSAARIPSRVGSHPAGHRPHSSGPAPSSSSTAGRAVSGPSQPAGGKTPPTQSGARTAAASSTAPPSRSATPSNTASPPPAPRSARSE